MKANQFNLIGEIRIGNIVGFVSLLLHIPIEVDESLLSGDENNLITSSNPLYWDLASIIKTFELLPFGYLFKAIKVDDKMLIISAEENKSSTTHKLDNKLH